MDLVVLAPLIALAVAVVGVVAVARHIRRASTDLDATVDDLSADRRQ